MRGAKMALVALVLACAATGGARAQQRVAALPELAPLTSARDNYVLTFNGRPLQTCQREWRSWNRVHGACHDLETATVAGRQLQAGTVVEFVLFDGTRYERVNDETRWTASPDQDFAPDLTLNEGLFALTEAGTLTLVGPTEVDGAAATQYQYWVTDEARNSAAGGQVLYDLFVSPGGAVLKSQASVRGTIAGLGAGELSEVVVYSAINAPVVVAPPPAAQVQP